MLLSFKQSDIVIKTYLCNNILNYIKGGFRSLYLQVLEPNLLEVVKPKKNVINKHL